MGNARPSMRLGQTSTTLNAIPAKVPWAVLVLYASLSSHRSSLALWPSQRSTPASPKGVLLNSPRRRRHAFGTGGLSVDLHLHAKIPASISSSTNPTARPPHLAVAPKELAQYALLHVVQLPDRRRDRRHQLKTAPTNPMEDAGGGRRRQAGRGSDVLRSNTGWLSWE